MELTEIQIEKGICNFKGILAFPMAGEVTMQVQVGKQIYPVNLTDHPDLEKYSFKGDLVRRNKEVHFQLPIGDEPVALRFEVLYNGINIPQKAVMKEHLAQLKTESMILCGKRISTQMKKILIENA